MEIKACRYLAIYAALIERAKKRPEITGYVERHHIVPRSCGGSNDPSNVVKLTAREHFLCHRLLVKFTLGDTHRKMALAIFMMCHNRHRFRVTARQYEQVRITVVNATKGRPKHSDETKQLLSRKAKEWHKMNIHPMKGQKLSPERVDKLRRVSLGVKRSEVHRAAVSAANRGKVLSEETRRKIAMANIGRIRPHTEETKKRISESLRGRQPKNVLTPVMTGKTHTDETKVKMRAGQANVSSVTCEKCGKTNIRPCHYGRWHGDRCRPT